MLVKTTLDALKQRNISKVALVVFKTNADGNAFWEKQGFTVMLASFLRCIATIKT